MDLAPKGRAPAGPAPRSWAGAGRPLGGPPCLAPRKAMSHQRGETEGPRTHGPLLQRPARFRYRYFLNVPAMIETLTAKSAANGSTTKLGWTLKGSDR